jgi:hypothetical protein
MARGEKSRSLVLKGSHYQLYFNQSEDMALDAASRSPSSMGNLSAISTLG